MLCWGTYDTGKPRTRILHEGLRAVGVSVREQHAELWQGIDDKSQLGTRRRISLLLRWPACYPRLVWRFLRGRRPDLVLVGYPGVLDLLLLAPLARLRRVPIVWDMFMSVYDTVVLDRAMLPAASLRARLLRWLEWVAVRLPRLVLLDTEAHARRIEQLFGLAPGRCGAVWVGAELERFRLAAAAPAAARARGAPLRVLFYGQLIPVHGVETIVRAARLTADEEIEWTVIGLGQEATRVRRLLEEVPLPKLRWIAWVDYQDLRRWIAACDVCLGIFGTSPKAASVIPNKVFQAVAAGRPIITRDSPAIRELLAPAPPCVYLVPPGDAAALAEALREHARPGPSQTQCHAALVDRIDAPAIGRQFLSAIELRLGGGPHAAGGVSEAERDHPGS